MKTTGILLIILSFSISSFSIGMRTTTKHRRFMAILLKCEKQHPDDEEKMLDCIQEEKLAANQAAIARKMP